VHVPYRGQADAMTALLSGGIQLLITAQGPALFARSVRTNLKADLTEATAQGRLTVQDVELAADIVLGIWLQVARGTLQRRPAPDLADRALDAVLRALGASQPHDGRNL
jgi:hypothetical protein